MKFMNLGRSGLSVSRLCLGTMNFGPETDEATAHAVMDAKGAAVPHNAAARKATADSGPFGRMIATLSFRPIPKARRRAATSSAC